MKKDLLKAAPVSATTSPSIILNGHYIRELSFDNKNAPSSFVPQKEAPKTEISINYNNRSLKDNLYEVFLLIKAQSNSMDKGALDLFSVQLVYAGLFTIKDIADEKQKEEILMIYCPNILFPYARRVVSDLTRDGGFQPLMLEHMDFAALYNQSKSKEKIE